MKRVVIGVGNPYRRDDGVGIEIAHRLRVRGCGDTTVLEHDGEPAGLLHAWEGAGVAYVIDAVRGDSPGRVHRVEILPDHPALPPLRARGSSHALGVGDAVELGRVLGRLPGRLVLLGIEGSDFTIGEGLSEQVGRTATAVAAELATELVTTVRTELSGRPVS